MAKVLLCDEKSPFDIFGLQPKFQLDIADLERRYLALQSSEHPDRFVIEDDQARRDATLRSSEINSAYKQLRIPFDRAMLLIQQGGIKDPLSSKYVLSSDFLMEQMERCEAFEDARLIQDKEKLLHLRQSWQNEIDTIWHYLEQALDTHGNSEQAASYLRQLRFLMAQLDQLEETLFDWSCI